MARRMHEQKEYYWQGKGGPDVTFKKIISELLGRDFDKYTRDSALGEPTDVYTLQFDCYNDIYAYEGHSIIHVPHDEQAHINFYMVILTEGQPIIISHETIMNNSMISDIEDHGFAVYLRKIASNQPYRYDWS